MHFSISLAPLVNVLSQKWHFNYLWIPTRHAYLTHKHSLQNQYIVTDFIQFIFYKIVCISKLFKVFFITSIITRQLLSQVLHYKCSVWWSACRHTSEMLSSTWHLYHLSEKLTQVICASLQLLSLGFVHKKQCLYRPFSLRCSTTTVNTFYF